MCNVPEIFLCFHQDGIVQKYELIKTEDLPSLENSKFSPKVIRNVAQNILSFLKVNATKAGHTYWLFKAKNDDVVKLYDLTTLQLLATTKDDADSESSEKKETGDQNPFTIPVGLLLYTVARNMKYSNEKLTAKQAGNIKQLLDNCLKLLPKDKYPQIVTSSHYILSDIQIQAGMDPANPAPFDDDEDSTTEDENSDELYDDQTSSDEDLDFKEGKDCYSAIQSIRDVMKESTGPNKFSSRPSPMAMGSIKERSESALKSIIDGLGCLEYFESEPSVVEEKKKEKEKVIEEELNPKLANPHIPIPMGWDEKQSGKESSKKFKKRGKKTSESVGVDVLGDSEVQLDSKSLLMKGSPSLKTWNTHLKVLLFEKASLAYGCLGLCFYFYYSFFNSNSTMLKFLGEEAYNEKHYGHVLRFLNKSIMCQNLVTKYVPGMTTQKGCLFGRAGDCYFQICKSIENAEQFIAESKIESDLDKEILKELEKEDIVKNELKKPTSNMQIEQMLEASSECYELSLKDIKESRLELVRRLGNVIIHFFNQKEIRFDIFYFFL
jgi:hypothetical protein